MATVVQEDNVSKWSRVFWIVPKKYVLESDAMECVNIQSREAYVDEVLEVVLND